MTPEDARRVAEFLVSDYEREIATTLRVIEAVPADRLDYRPDPKAKSALHLIRHLALEDAWFLHSIVDGQFNQPPADTDDACGIATPADGAARYKEGVSAALQRVRGMSGEDLTRVIDLFGMIQAPALNFLATGLKHSVHHRGQLSTYLRPMGGKVPGIYGPSADTQ